MNAISWIMTCTTLANFAILVNGSPTSFFQSSRGLRQGCRLSPLLFLIIEGLSRLVDSAKRQKKIQGNKISSHSYISHLLFVDDVLLFGLGSLKEWEAYRDIICVFCDASRMNISGQKFLFIHNNFLQDILDQISIFFPFNLVAIDEGFKYLGYVLKPNCCKKDDWYWLL